MIRDAASTAWQFPIGSVSLSTGNLLLSLELGTVAARMKMKKKIEFEIGW